MSRIEWTDVTWNPVRGCSRVSPGCDSCYAMRQAHRFSGPGGPYQGLTTIRRGKVDWSGRVRLVPEMLELPLRWRKSRRIFVNSMSDLFHEALSDEEIAAVFGVMAAAPQHTFQVLTKRAKRMRETLNSASFIARVELFVSGKQWADQEQMQWPLPQVWAGVSAEDQQRADDRIAHLLNTPAAIRFISAEPLLGPIDVSRWDPGRCDCERCRMTSERCPASRHPIDWVIVGSESGTKARSMQLEWIASLRDQCADVGVPFFTKQIASRLDRKGGDPKYWPPGPWPRQFPEVRA